MSDCQYNLKVLLIGNSNVGKSCLLTRFSDDKFQNKLLNTIGVDFVQLIPHRKPKQSIVMGKKLNQFWYPCFYSGNSYLKQWDTAGQQRFRTITNSYYRNANGIIIVYDLTDRESFENVVNWYEEMNKSVNLKVACLLVANKLDLNSRRVVSYEQGLALANKYKLPFTQTSAKTAHNVAQLFQNLTRQMLRLGQGKTVKRRPPLPLRQNQDGSCYCKFCGN